jgi:site-specific recombinase XerD
MTTDLVLGHAAALLPTVDRLAQVVEPAAPGELAHNVVELPAVDRLSHNAAAVYLASLAPGSRRTMAQALDTIAGLAGGTDSLSLPWHLLRAAHTAAIRAKLAEQFAAARANKMLSALRGVLKAAWRLGQLDGHSYQRAVDVPAVKGSTLPRGRSLEPGELRALFAACAADDSPAGKRDAALLAVLYGAGLRRSEAAALVLDNYNQGTGELRVESGKGNKARLVYVANGGKRAVDTWLAVRGNEPGPLFVPINKAGNVVHRALTDQAVYNCLVKRGEQAGLPHFSPHDMRRSFVSDLLDSGADISTVQKLAGHANVNTTQRYDRRDEHTKKRAAELLHVPYRD